MKVGAVEGITGKQSGFEILCFGGGEGGYIPGIQNIFWGARGRISGTLNTERKSEVLLILRTLLILRSFQRGTIEKTFSSIFFFLRLFEHEGRRSLMET